jgi:hypothetical protein
MRLLGRLVRSCLWLLLKTPRDDYLISKIYLPPFFGNGARAVLQKASTVLRTPINSGKEECIS